MEIVVTNLSYSIILNKSAKPLLREVTFKVSGGELCALMGPSGAGKSTLLDLLADRKMDGIWSGSVTFNGRDRSRWFNRESAYVLQDDIHISTLTVAETIYYSALTRLPEGTPQNLINNRVDLLLNITGLSHVRDTIVGDGMTKGISGGQLKRLSIAVEIVALPDLIFLDEPTSGLDSTIALEVMTSVRRLANQNRTCVSTIHQPSAEVFALFDTVVLLSSGRLIYFGTAKDAIRHFNSLGFTMNKGVNPAEFIIDISSGQIPATSSGGYATRSLTAEQLEKLFRESEFSTEDYRLKNPIQRNESSILDDFRIDSINKPMHNRRHATYNGTQFVMLMKRTWKALIRDVSEQVAQLIKSFSVGTLVGVVFFNQANLTGPLYENGFMSSQVTNVTTIIFFGMMYVLVANIQSIPYLCNNSKLYRRELASYTYSTAPYWLSQCLVALPILFVNHMLFGTLCFFLCGFRLDFEYFLYFTINLFLCNISSYYFAMFLAVIINHEQIAIAVFPIVFMFLLTFAGFSITINDVPPFWSWAPWISYARWSFEGLMINEFGTYDTDDNPYAINGNGNVLAYYSFENFSKWTSIWILLAYNVGIVAMIYIFLRPKKKNLKYVADATDFENIRSVQRNLTDFIANSDQTNPLTESLIDSSGHSLIPPHSGSASSYSQGADQRHVQPVSGETSRYRVPNLPGGDSSSLNSESAGGGGEGDDMSDWDVSTKGGMTVMFKNVCYSVENNSVSKKREKTLKLLDNVFGCAKPSEMVALMGASGAGKSTLLDVLACRKTTGEITGDIFMNGERQSASLLQNNSAYVMQDNVHIGELTVRETMYYASRLRLSEKWPEKIRQERVDLVVKMLGLQGVLDTIVGTDHQRGISGGQLKRLSIGVEILGLPELIYLDEPTTGLDSAIAYDLVYSLKKLCKQNRTIISTIHQPSPQTFLLFNQLLLLSAGRVVYFGRTEDSLKYFNDSPVKVPWIEGINPADYIVSIASVDAATVMERRRRDAMEVSEKLELVSEGGDLESSSSSGKNDEYVSLADHYERSQMYADFVEEFGRIDAVHQSKAKTQVLSQIGAGAGSGAGAGAGFKAVYTTSLFNQVMTLSSRVALVHTKNYKVLIVSIMRHVMVGLFYGSIYFHLSNNTTDQSAYNTRLCLFFFSCTFLIIGHQSTIPVLQHSRLLFYRERGSYSYGSLAYWISCWFMEIPIIAINTTVFGAIVYYMTQLRDADRDDGSVNSYLVYFLMLLFINSLIGFFICHFISAVSPNTQSAVSFYPVFFFYTMAFAGFIVYLPRFQDWLGSWAPYGSFMRYTLEGLVQNEFKDNSALPLGQSYIDMLGYNSFTKEECVPILIGFCVMFALSVLWALEYVSFEKR